METSALPSRPWILATHLSAFAGFIIPFGNIIGPLIIWLMKKDEFPLVDKHGKESINFQISLTFYVIVSLFLMLIVIGMFLLVALAVIQVACIIIAAIKADKGEFFHYPISFKFLA